MTIGHVAASTGLTKGFLSRVERDLTSPSVSTLVSICDVLSIEIGDLFVASDVQLVTADDAPRINLGGDGTSERLLSPRREARMQVIRSTVEPGGNGGDKPYTVNSELELLHVISGSVDFWVSDGAWTLNAGDSITFDGREPHQWRADGGAELLWVLVPAAWGGAI